MSAEKRGPFHGHLSFPGSDLSTLFMAEIKGAGSADDAAAALQVFDPQTAAAAPPPFVSLADYLHGPAAMDYGLLAWTSLDAAPDSLQDVLGGGGGGGGEGGELGVVADDGGGYSKAVDAAAAGCVAPRPVTPNSSMSSSSMENLAGEEESRQQAKQEEGERLHAKGGDDGGEGRDDKLKKKVNKAGKKKEKRERAPRFAFMTKSEVDHLEDGYRWRKYGQKAVKNSPFPRSYYRCTAQSCNVKKRVERSYQDPATVVTTYEGQHTHHCPANYFRGSTHYFLSALSPPPPHPPPPPPPLPMQMPSFRRSLHFRRSSISQDLVDDRCVNPNAYATYTTPPPPQPQPQPAELQAPDYGLLQDIVSSSPPYTAANYNN